MFGEAPGEVVWANDTSDSSITAEVIYENAAITIHDY